MRLACREVLRAEQPRLGDALDRDEPPPRGLVELLQRRDPLVEVCAGESTSPDSRSGDELRRLLSSIGLGSAGLSSVGPSSVGPRSAGL